MTRAVFLPSSGDPFLLKKWLECFKVWANEVDVLYVCINAPIDNLIRSYIHALLEGLPVEVCIFDHDHNIDHGPAITQMLEVCEEDLILLIEEDGMIFKPDQVNDCFKLIESGEYDVIAGARGSCAEELWKKENEVFPDSPEQQPNFWPNFLFVKRSDLLRTDRNFAGKAWQKGDVIPYLNHTVEDDVIYSDTFVWASIQLRGLGLRIKLLPQYHAMVEDLEMRERIEGVFDRKAPWVHLGSSSSWMSMLMSPEIPERQGIPEMWEIRAGYWLMCWEDAQEQLPDSLRSFSTQYKQGIDRLIKDYTLSEARVNKRAELYRNLLKNII